MISFLQQVMNGGAEGSWYVREFQEEAGEEPIKVRGENGRERLTKRANALKMESRRRKGRPRLRWEDCVKKNLAGVGGEWRMKARDGGVETGGKEGSKMGSVMEKKENKNQQMVLVLDSSVTPGIKRRAATLLHTIARRVRMYLDLVLYWTL